MNAKIRLTFRYDKNKRLCWGQVTAITRQTQQPVSECQVKSPVRVLLLVISSDSYPFDLLKQAQQRTWASEKEPGTRIVFYISGDGPTKFNDPVLHLDCPGDFDSMSWRLKCALDYVQAWDWDFLFHTNASAYVDLKQLAKYAASLPKQGVYHGIDGTVADRDFRHVNGGGLFLSRDTAMLLKDELKTEQTSLALDAEIGRIMHELKVPIAPGKRTETTSANARTEKGAYHYKLRSCDPDRANEIAAMHALHRQLCT